MPSTLVVFWPVRAWNCPWQSRQESRFTFSFAPVTTAPVEGTQSTVMSVGGKTLRTLVGSSVGCEYCAIQTNRWVAAAS